MCLMSPRGPLPLQQTGKGCWDMGRWMSWSPSTHLCSWPCYVYSCFPYFKNIPSIFLFTFVSPFLWPPISRWRISLLPKEIPHYYPTLISPGLFGLSELHHLEKMGWLDTLQGRSAAHVTSSYWGDVDHGQMAERGLEGVYSIVTKGKQFREFKFHLQGRKKMLKQ